MTLAFVSSFFFFNDTATTEIYTLSLHDALPIFTVTPASRTRREPCSMKNSTYSVRSQAVSTVKKSHATIAWAWLRRNSPHDGPPRRGAGPQPERRRTDLIVVAPTRMPSLRSSP